MAVREQFPLAVAISELDDAGFDNLPGTAIAVRADVSPVLAVEPPNAGAPAELFTGYVVAGDRLAMAKLGVGERRRGECNRHAKREACRSTTPFHARPLPHAVDQ